MSTCPSCPPVSRYAGDYIMGFWKLVSAAHPRRHTSASAAIRSARFQLREWGSSRRQGKSAAPETGGQGTPESPEGNCIGNRRIAAPHRFSGIGLQQVVNNLVG